MAHVSARPLGPLENPFMGMSRLEGLFAGLGLTVGVGLAWVYFDRPISMGRQVQGTIIQCRGLGGNATRWCLVKTADGHSIPVTIPHGRPHDTITLNISRRRISKELLYDPDLSEAHQPPDPDASPSGN